MEADTPSIDVHIPTSFKDQFAKVMIGSIAGFMATKLAEKAYDRAIEAYRSRKG